MADSNGWTTLGGYHTRALEGRKETHEPLEPQPRSTHLELSAIRSTAKVDSNGLGGDTREQEGDARLTRTAEPLFSSSLLPSRLELSDAQVY